MPRAGQSCSNCLYSGRSLGSPTGLRCRRSPPVVLPVHAEGDFASRYPVIEPDLWCGEWVAENPTVSDEVASQLARAVLVGDGVAARALADRLIELGVGG